MDNNNIISEVTDSEYKYGFVSDIEHDTIGKGLSEDTIRLISSKKEERLFYQNRRSAMARFCNMDTNATFYANLCNIFANKKKHDL